MAENKLLSLVEKMQTEMPEEAPLFSNEKAEQTYEAAYQMYQGKQYKEAAKLFCFLTVLNPMEPKYWKGLGAAYQMNNEYQKAISSYMSAQFLKMNKQDPYLYVYIADCHFALNHKEEGLKALEGAEVCAQEQDDLPVLNHVSVMRDQWTKNKKCEVL